MEKRLTPVARKLRTDQTDAEKLLWSRLRNRQLGAKFVRQYPIGNYVADFAARSARLIVELDGGQHNVAADADRTQALAADGFHVIRFWNNDVIENIDGVLEEIARALSLAR